MPGWGRGSGRSPCSPYPDSKGSVAASAAAPGCCLSGSHQLSWFDTRRALVCCCETRGLTFYSNIREGGIEEKGSRMSTKKLSCANKQNRWIIPCCLRRELLECLPAAGAPRSCRGPGPVFHGGLAGASPPVCLGLVEQSASRSFSQAVGWLHTRWLRAKAVGEHLLLPAVWVNSTTRTSSLPASLPPTFGLR